MIKVFIDRDTLQSVMYDDVEEYAFGPVFGSDEDPVEFLDWMQDTQDYSDVRRLESNLLVGLVDMWRKEVEENENEARAERVYSDTAATTINETCDNARKLK